LADRDAADVIAVQFGDVLADRIVQPQFAAQRSLRDQRGLEQLAQRSDIEQRIRRDGSSRRLVSEAIVEKLYPARDVRCGREAAGMLGHGRGKIACDDALYLVIHGWRRGGRLRQAGKANKQDGQSRGIGDARPASRQGIFHSDFFARDGGVRTGRSISRSFGGPRRAGVARAQTRRPFSMELDRRAFALKQAYA
jgi:hypothetical protein